MKYLCILLCAVFFCSCSLLTGVSDRDNLAGQTPAKIGQIGLLKNGRLTGKSYLKTQNVEVSCVSRTFSSPGHLKKAVAMAGEGGIRELLAQYPDSTGEYRYFEVTVYDVLSLVEAVNSAQNALSAKWLCDSPQGVLVGGFSFVCSAEDIRRLDGASKVTYSAGENLLRIFRADEPVPETMAIDPGSVFKYRYLYPCWEYDKKTRIVGLCDLREKGQRCPGGAVADGRRVKAIDPYEHLKF